jgi:hypothetical protein
MILMKEKNIEIRIMNPISSLQEIKKILSVLKFLL